MKHAILLVGLLLSLHSVAETPALTIYNQDGDAHSANIKIMVMNLDGELCYENKNVSQYHYRTQIMPSEMTCHLTENFVVFADYIKHKTRYKYRSTPNPRLNGNCWVENYKDTFGHKLVVRC